MAEFYISGIWKDGERITHVLLHESYERDKKTKVKPGKKATEAQIISLIKNGNKVYTMKWKYTGKGWLIGAEVVIVSEENGDQYVRTTPDATTLDNLLSMIDMKIMGL